VKGGQSQRREVRGAGGANGVECGEGVSPPHLRRGLGRGLCPLPRNFFNFFGFNVFKNFCVQAKGGGHRPVPPPLNTPLVPVYIT